jgi:CRP-like cAMP-binding protein
MKSRNDIECETCSNENCFIKKYCSQEWISKISKSKSNIRCKKGHSIILEGSPVMGMYFIYKGKVKVTIIGGNDKEQIVRLAADGHTLGHRGYGGENYPIGATSVSDSVVCFVDNEILYKAFMANPEFTFQLMMFYSKELRKTEQRIKYLAQMTVREKVAFALYYLTDIFGFRKGEKTLNVILSRQEIANLAGTTADQVSREITGLKKEKILDTNGKKIIIINSKKLQEIIQAYSSL